MGDLVFVWNLPISSGAFKELFSLFMCFQDWLYTASYTDSVPASQKSSIVPPLSIKNYNAIETASEA